jgi:hypothetical protein
MRLRVRFKGENVRSARLLDVLSPSSEQVPGEALLAALAAEGVDCCGIGARWTPTFYDVEHSGWARLQESTVIADNLEVVDVLLSDGLVCPHWRDQQQLQQQQQLDTANGYFGIGEPVGELGGLGLQRNCTSKKCL